MMNLVRRIALFGALTLMSVPVLAAAAPEFDIRSLIRGVIFLIVVGVIVGLLIMLVRKAPFIPGEWKTGIEYVIWFVLVIILIYWLLNLVGM